VLLRGVLGCNDVGGAAALSASSCAAGEARLQADRAAARQTGLLRCGRSCGAAGGALRGGRGCCAVGWVDDAANGADARRTGRRTVLLRGGRGCSVADRPCAPLALIKL